MTITKNVFPMRRDISWESTGDYRRTLLHGKSVPVTGLVVAQRVGRGIALLFHDRGTRREWVVSITPRPYFNPRKDPVPIVQEAGWAPRPVWTDEKPRPIGIRYPGGPVRSQSLYRLIYRAHSVAWSCVTITLLSDVISRFTNKISVLHL